MEMRISKTPVLPQLLVGIIPGLLIFALLAGCRGTESAETPGSLPVDEDSNAISVERGEYIVSTAGCNDCHTPWIMGAQGPEPDQSRFLSGHPQDFKVPPPPPLSQEGWAWASTATNTAFVGPWGITYARNLTSDRETGLGAWTEEMFVQAIRTGKHMGVASSRPIMPPMPWTVYANLTDEDLKSVFAFLQTVPPISNQAPEYEPPAGSVQ